MQQSNPNAMAVVVHTAEPFGLSLPAFSGKGMVRILSVSICFF